MHTSIQNVGLKPVIRSELAINPCGTEAWACGTEAGELY
jgi:hypothetical protein